MLTRARRARRRMPRDDSGFSLVEVVVAMVVFAVMVTAVLGVALGIFDVTRSNTHRVAAANLATKQIESTRSMRAVDIPDSAVSRVETVAGTDFTITQTANYVVAGSDGSVCEGSGDQLAYKLVTVTVTWPNMGSVAPVRSDTLLALGLGDDALDATRGSLAVAVTGATGSPVAGVAVTLTPGGAVRTTGVDGCAVFTDLVPSTYTASAGQSGYVSHVNVRAAQLSQGVAEGQVSRAELLYDAARTLPVTWDAPSGHVPPPNLPLRYRSNYISDGAVLPLCAVAPAGNACVGAVPGDVQNLYPAIYELSAGSCVDAQDGTADVDLVVADGDAAVPLAGYRVRVVNLVGDPVSGLQVTVSHASDSDATGCTSGESYPVDTLATGESLTALPFGEWTFSAPGAGSVTESLSPGDGVRDVVLVLDGVE